VQTAPHPPQFKLSLCGLTQVPFGQRSIPGPQVGLQALEKQAVPASQATPHAPQLALSVDGSVQRPVPTGH